MLISFQVSFIPSTLFGGLAMGIEGNAGIYVSGRRGHTVCKRLEVLFDDVSIYCKKNAQPRYWTHVARMVWRSESVLEVNDF